MTPRILVVWTLVCWTTSQAFAVPDSLQWGPTSGEITWSLRKDGLRWSTPHLDLTLQPWATMRAVGRKDENFQVDNLRGAAFQATLDGRWHVSGSLEELQGVPSIWDQMAPASEDALPGWGRVKTLQDGRVDVARARSQTSWQHGLGARDTLNCAILYGAYAWGPLPSALSFSSRASSYPLATLHWQHGKSVQLGGAVARWTRLERGDQGGSTEGLFRQVDARWLDLTWFPSTKRTLGILVGQQQLRPWSYEQPMDSLGTWDPMRFISLTGTCSWHASWPELFAEWTSHNGWGVGWRWELDHGYEVGMAAFHQATLPELSKQWSHAGTPVGDPMWFSSDAGANWRIEANARMDKRAFRMGTRGAWTSSSRIAELWMGYAIQSTWPMNVFAGAELWSSEAEWPGRGSRWRVGIAHALGMTAGNPTFAAP